MRALAAALCLLLVLLPPGLAQARPITEAERAGLVARIESFDAAMRSNDQATLLGVVPPAVIAMLAEANGMTVEQLTVAMAAAMAEAMTSVEFVSFAMALDDARYEELPDGTPYVMIPTETVMRINGEGTRAVGETLAMLDGGAWYLVRVSEAAQVDILKQVYPGFAAVDFPAGTMEAVE